MGADLYISIESRYPRSPGRDPKVWVPLFEGRSTALARWPLVDEFGTAEQAEGPGALAAGYLTYEQKRDREVHEDCPWHRQEPYWVRLLTGAQFTAIVFGRPAAAERGPVGAELAALAIAVNSLMAWGDVQVWCWCSP